jgi:hypothetical protein
MNHQPVYRDDTIPKWTYLLVPFAALMLYVIEPLLEQFRR